WRCGAFLSAGEPVTAFAIDEAQVDVQARTCALLERLGHETGDETVLAGHRLDGAFQQHRVVAGKYRVRDVLQVDLELSGGELGSRGPDRDVLCPAYIVDVVQEVVDIPQVVGMVYLRPDLRPPD